MLVLFYIMLGVLICGLAVTVPLEIRDRMLEKKRRGFELRNVRPHQPIPIAKRHKP